MIEGIISILNASLETTGRIDKRHCLVELRERSDKDNTIVPYEYTGKGQFKSVDIGNPSLSWWRLTDKPSFEEAPSSYSQNKLQANYPLRLVVMFRRKDSTNDDGFSPSRFAEDISNLLTRTNGDLRTQLQASQVKVSVNSFDSDTTRVWGEEFQVPLKDPKYTTALISVEINVEVTARRECWENECDYDSDILHLFNFCDTGVQNRLTETQVDCLSDWLCGTPTPAILQLNGSTLTNIASGVTYNLLIQNTDGSSVGTLANPSIIADSQAQVNGVNTESIPATTTHNQQVHDTAGSDVGTASNPSVIADGTIQNNVAGDWTDSIKAEETKTLAQLKYVDTDQVTEISVDYYPNTVQAVATCTPADYGTQIGTILCKKYGNPFMELFGLIPLTDRALTADLVYLERGGDGDNQFYGYTAITDGTVAAWMSAGGGDGSAKIVHWIGHYGSGIIAYNNTTSQQWEIGSGGVIHTDGQGNPTAVCTGVGGYFVGATGGGQELPLLSSDGSFIYAGKKANTTTISRLFTASGNPSIGIADTTSNPTSLNSGSPTSYVGNVALALEQRDNLQAAMNNVEAIVFIDNVGWSSGTWRLSSALSFLNNFQSGSQVTLFGISNNNQSLYRTEIFTAINAELNYH